MRAVSTCALACVACVLKLSDELVECNSSLQQSDDKSSCSSGLPLISRWSIEPIISFFVGQENTCDLKMGQLNSFIAGALSGCCFREIETIVENHVRQKVEEELSLLREELTACSSSCLSRSCRFLHTPHRTVTKRL